MDNFCDFFEDMFAKEDFEEAGPPLSSCYGCGKPILDRFLLTVLDKGGHRAFLKKSFILPLHILLYCTMYIPGDVVIDLAILTFSIIK